MYLKTCFAMLFVGIGWFIQCAADDTLSLKASFAPTITSRRGRNCYIHTNNIANAGILHPHAAKVIWRILDDDRLISTQDLSKPSPFRCVHDDAYIKSFVPWLGFSGDESDYVRFSTRLKKQLGDAQLQRTKFFPLDEYAIVLGAFCDRDIPGARDLATELLSFDFWMNIRLEAMEHRFEQQFVDLAELKLSREDQKKRVEASKKRFTSEFMLTLANWSRFPQSRVQHAVDFLESDAGSGNERSAFRLMRHSLDGESLEAQHHRRSLLHNPPKVTAELNQELENRFDEVYNPELKKYFEDHFRECERPVTNKP